LCWGSFLNVLAYRFIHAISIVYPRSSCPRCGKVIAWFDLIPVLSWLFLHGKCRACSKPISALYPIIELLTAILLSLAYIYIPHNYYLGYFIFISALIVTIRSDIETMLISPYVTLYLVPCAFVLSSLHMIPISLPESLIGALCGYSFLLIINYIFKRFTQRDGIGEGDFDLLCLIGSFTGVIGLWASVTIGSAIGSLYGLLFLTYNRYSTKIPFGPFLAFGALCYIFIHCLY